jgi:hypothetical protein
LESSSRPKLLVEHDLFRKPVSAFFGILLWNVEERMNSRMVALVFTLTTMASLQSAWASTYLFTLTGKTTYTFDLPSNPTPLGSDGFEFYLAAPAGMPTSFITFYSKQYSGGFSAGTGINDLGGTNLFDLSGAQLYSGSVKSPQFVLGTYDFIPFTGDFGASTLTISPISATPLPAALPLFAGGLGALGLLGWCRRRKQRTPSQQQTCS